VETVTDEVNVRKKKALAGGSHLSARKEKKKKKKKKRERTRERGVPRVGWPGWAGSAGVGPRARPRLGCAFFFLSFFVLSFYSFLKSYFL
jgi:hypothetical protein